MTSVGIPYKRASLASSWDAIVIGSGMGGLAAAALLAQHGRKRVLVLERHYTAGGYTHVFRRPQFEWDVGVHYIGNVLDPKAKVRATFDHVTGGRLAWNAMPDIYDEVRIGERRFGFVAGRERFRDMLVGAFPHCRKDIDRYLNLIASIDRSSFGFFGEKALPREAAAVVGPLMRAPYLRWAERTTAEVLAELTSDAELRGVLAAQWGDYGLPPARSSFAVHAILAMHYLAGGAFPVGGSAAIAAAVAPAIEATGGTIVVGAEVEEIVLDKGGRARGVRLTNGHEFAASAVISDAGAANTFLRLLPPERAPRALVEAVRSIGPSPSFVTLYAGLDAPAARLGLGGGNIWVHPSFDHDQNCARFAADPSGPFPMLFISFPSAKDPTFEERYPGRSTIDMLTFVPYDQFAPWEHTRWKHRGAEYEERKARFGVRLREELERNVPAARGHIAYSEVSTPLSSRHFANYTHGEAYGLASSPERFACRDLRAQTPIPNLFLTGQDLVQVGVVGALFGGVLAASAMLRRNLVDVVTRPFPVRPAAAALAAGLLAGCGGVAAHSATAEPPVVAVQRARAPQAEPLFSGAAAVVPSHVYRLAFELPGRVATVTAQVGEHISAGTVLATLDAGSYQAQVDQAMAGVAETRAEARKAAVGARPQERADAHDGVRAARAQLEEARASLALAQADAGRADRLYQAGAISAQADDQSTAGRRAAAARVQAASAGLLAAEQRASLVDAGTRSEDRAAAVAQAQNAEATLAGAQIALQKTVLRAPAGGYVQDRSIEPGDAVGPGVPAFTIIDDSVPDVVVAVPEVVAASIAVGMPARVTSGGRSYAARVERMEPAADAATRTVDVRLRSAHLTARPGSVVIGAIGARRAAGARVPASAIITASDGATSVAVVDRSSIVHVRHVRVLGTEGDTAIVLGVATGESIVSEGEYLATDGQRVAIAPAEP